jgi:hypothetical protein
MNQDPNIEKDIFAEVLELPVVWKPKAQSSRRHNQALLSLR